VCTAPSLSGGDPLDSSINYTVVMDNAPGPSNTGDLSLSLVPDPSILPDGSALSNAVFTPGNFIQIRGMNLDSVQPSEIRVLVGGELCNIEGQLSAELVKIKCTWLLILH